MTAAATPHKRKPGSKKQPKRAAIKTQAAVSAIPESKFQTALPAAWTIATRAVQLVWRRKGLFSGISIVYGGLNLVLVEGLASGTTLSSLQSSSRALLHGHGAAIGSSLGNFALFIGSADSGSAQGASVWQFMIVIIASLAIIWALRQAANQHKARIRDAYYGGMYPLIPFILTLIVIGLELLPLIISAALYGVVITNGIAAHGYEQVIWVIILLGGLSLTLFLLASSIVSLYIVTLPDMTPLKSLRSARDLVRGRRLSVIRKLLFLPFVLLVVAAIIILPTIAVSSGATVIVFFAINLLSLLAVHSYLYSLYRELLA
jgi:hypothetical protein